MEVNKKSTCQGTKKDISSQGKCWGNLGNLWVVIGWKQLLGAIWERASGLLSLSPRG